MSEDITLLECGNLAMVQVKVGPTDRGASDLDDDVVGFSDIGGGDIYHAYVLCTEPCEGLHA